MIDVDRLRRELEFVTAHPDRWKQDAWYVLPTSSTVETEPGTDWTCGTTACLAGWTALHADLVPVSAPGHHPDGVYVRDGDGHDWLVDDAAVDLLRLGPDEAELLFDGGNTLRDLWEYARVFTGGRIEVPPTVADGELCTFEPDDEDYYASLGASSPAVTS
jgi:hypothetical protein